MSVFNDFQQVWLQRFPDNPLPGAWEEHIKINLAKHKQKVSMFKEEVRKEEIYVEYLERLLLDIQKHKKPEDGESSKNESADVTADNISNVNIALLLSIYKLGFCRTQHPVLLLKNSRHSLPICV